MNQFKKKWYSTANKIFNKITCLQPAQLILSPNAFLHTRIHRDPLTAVKEQCHQIGKQDKDEA